MGSDEVIGLIIDKSQEDGPYGASSCSGTLDAFRMAERLLLVRLLPVVG